MILYKKVFPLGKGVSFSRYLKALREKNFPNHVLLIERILATENYRAEIVFTLPVWRWGWHNMFHEGILLEECTIQHSKGERYFTLQASSKGGNLFFVSFYIIMGLLSFIFAFHAVITNDDTSLNNILTSIIIMIVVLAPPVSIYLRDANFLNNVGSLGTELEKSS